MGSTANFPDQNHFEQIRKRLWCYRDFGQAAVMVGSGFSRNAEKISLNTPDFPLWSGLASKIYDELNPQDFSNKEQAITNPLSLASEYEIVFGRAALDDFLNRSIPDNQYKPERLHKLLMSLPWSDIFTTNYDTLLERTLPAIYDRKYDLVCTQSDIPGKMKPRIIKLHGSLPSYRPFVFTEEDYRTYPKKFAPFVNMVQQSIMENVFCLVGFSGDDPNFLSWIGWVRDNLGESTPPIYLCGLLENLSEAKKQILRYKNIFTVDLSPVFPKSKWPDTNLRHSKSVEWFLLSLMNGKPPNLMSWPGSLNSNEWSKSKDLPDLVPPSTPLLPSTPPQPRTHEVNEGQLPRQREEWSQIREAYPGWIVCPRKNRENLWLHTQGWIDPVFDSVGSIQPPENLFLLYELNWRLELTLTPLFADWVEKLVAVLNKFNPFPRIINIEEADIRPDKSEYKNLNWQKIQKAWTELCFAVVRTAREDHRKDEFQLWLNRLQNVVAYDTGWQARWFYEKCLFHISRFEDSQTYQVLEDWPTMSNLDFWEVKRASILAEMGELKEAERVAELALASIRSRLQPYSVDYMLLSQEAWTMHLLNMIKSSSLNFARNWTDHYRDRWQQLEPYKCNVWSELEGLQIELDKIPPRPQPENQQQPGFYPGTISRTWHFSGVSSWVSRRPGFSLLRMFEESGTPLRCGMVSQSARILNAAKWIIPFAPRWSMTSVLRLRDTKKIKDLLDYIHIAALTEEDAVYVYNLLFNSLSNLFNDSTRYSRDVELGDLQAQIQGIANLSFRVSIENIEELLNIAIKIYNVCLSRRDYRYRIGQAVNNLFKGIFYALPESKIIELMPIILALPLPENLSENDLLSLKDPFVYIQVSGDSHISDRFDDPNCLMLVRSLISSLAAGNPVVRSCAALRLNLLSCIMVFSEEDQQLFGQALWSKIDSQTQLPIDTPFRKFAFLELPEPEHGIAKRNLRRYLDTVEFPSLYQNKEIEGQEVMATSGLDYECFLEILKSTYMPIFHEQTNKDKFIDWTSEEAENLLNKSYDWWVREKDGIRAHRNLPLVNEDIERWYKYFSAMIAKVILPRLKNCTESSKEKIEDLLLSLDEGGFTSLSILPMTLFVSLESIGTIASCIRQGFSSSHLDEINGSIEGFYSWLIYGQRGDIPQPPPDLLNDLSTRVLTRVQPGLNASIGFFLGILNNVPALITEDQVKSLCLALEYLLIETKLPDLGELEILNETSSRIGFVDRPLYRFLASQLAHDLYCFFLQKNKDQPEILIRWKQDSESDISPKVREIWE